MATYYVSNDGGSDSNSGTSPSEPWETITRALDAGETVHTQPGDTVLIEGIGEYEEDPVITVAGTSTAPIRLIATAPGFAAPAWGDMPVTVRGHFGTSLSAGDAFYAFEGIRQLGKSASPGWDLLNLRVCFYRFCAALENDGSSSDGFVIGWNSQLFGCTAAGNGRHGFHAPNGIAVLDYCRAIENATNGIYLLGNNAIIQHSVAHANGGVGIAAAVPASTVHIENVTVDGNATGLQVGGRWATVKNCIIANNTVGASGYGTVGDFYTNAMHNLFYGNGTDRNNNFPVGSGDLSADPLFANRAADDFSLLPGSPAIGAGWPNGLDLGAFQSQPLSGGYSRARLVNHA